MIWRRTFLSLILLTAVVMSACAAPAAPAAAPATDQTAALSEPVRGGAVVVGTPQEPGVLNPLLASSSIEDAISSLTIEGLVQVDDQGELCAGVGGSSPHNIGRWAVGNLQTQA